MRIKIFIEDDGEKDSAEVELTTVGTAKNLSAIVVYEAISQANQRMLDDIVQHAASKKIADAVQMGAITLHDLTPGVMNFKTEPSESNF